MCYAVAMKTLSVTEASRSFSDWVNRVYSRKESFAIVKLGVPYALLVPAAASGCNSHELATDLAGATLPAEERRNLAAALRKGRKALKPLKNPWVLGLNA
jgi:antitoxin (DNA-binding transcriptional repressor) of toxin-antitoxin stability system